MRISVIVSAALLLTGVGGVWFAVSTDAWPWDDRSEPAKTVWAFNDKVGKFLYDHGQDTAEEIAAARPRREALTGAESAEVQKQLENDPRLKDRIVLHAGGGFVGGASGFKLKPAVASRG
ncbi:MAG: hypothetical protein QM765_16440 [Myxococcales bacterium]